MNQICLFDLDRVVASERTIFNRGDTFCLLLINLKEMTCILYFKDSYKSNLSLLSFLSRISFTYSGYLVESMGNMNFAVRTLAVGF